MINITLIRGRITPLNSNNFLRQLLDNLILSSSQHKRGHNLFSSHNPLFTEQALLAFGSGPLDVEDFVEGFHVGREQVGEDKVEEGQEFHEIIL
jgi:hypothetical protein